jgi:exopolysaccharide biosynthesis polyprenyl glycosylphosphotransferase
VRGDLDGVPQEAGGVSKAERSTESETATSTPVVASGPDVPALGGPWLPWGRGYATTLLAVDAVSGMVGALLAQWLRLALTSASLRVYGTTVPYIVVAAGATLIWLALLGATGAYQRKILGVGTEEYRRVLRTAVRLLAVVVVIVFLSNAAVARSLVFGLVALMAVATVLGRYAARKWLQRQRTHGRQIRRMVVLGREEAIRQVTDHLDNAADYGFSVVGTLAVTNSRAEDEGGGLAGDDQFWLAEAVFDALERKRPDVLAVAGTEALPTGALRTLAWQVERTGVDLIVVPTITDVAGPRVTVQAIAGLPLLHVEPPRLSGGARLLKDAMDRVVSVLALVVLAPVLFAVAGLVRLTSPGPAIFRQERIGRDGKPFTMWKFRTMTVDAEHELEDLVTLNEQDGLLFKIREDPRVTGVGRWLRRFSIDELPQLLHVVRGKMSLVGPRPPLPSEVERYPDDVRRRLLVKPGITGLWQVSGRADLPWDETVRLDLYYIDNWSLSMDFVIMMKTVAAVLRGRGAY